MSTVLPAEATKKQLYLSASRIDTFLSCSALYSAKYLYKIPDASNDGAKRGSTVHAVLELLLKPRHRKRYMEAIHHDTCTEVPPLWRLVVRFAKKYDVDDPENLETIDKFIMVALKHNFFGPKETKEILGEKKFNIDVNDPVTGLRYSIRGSIDKTFVIQGKKGPYLEVIDYKSSKAKMSGDKLEDNVQSQMYQLALRHLYPEIRRRQFDFLFLKFSTSPLQPQPTLTDAQLDGFAWRLHYTQQAIEGFTKENALDWPAASESEKMWLCGREGFKKDGTKSFICAARNPITYWSVLEAGGEVVSSHFTEAEATANAKPADGQTVEKRHYPGCPYYFSPSGQRRNFN